MPSGQSTQVHMHICSIYTYTYIYTYIHNRMPSWKSTQLRRATPHITLSTYMHQSMSANMHQSMSANMHQSMSANMHQSMSANMHHRILALNQTCILTHIYTYTPGCHHGSRHSYAELHRILHDQLCTPFSLHACGMYPQHVFVFVYVCVCVYIYIYIYIYICMYVCIT